MRKKILSRYQTDRLTFKGFESCVEYAENAFYPDFRVARDYTKKDYILRAKQEFFRNVEGASKSHILDIGGFDLLREFNFFKNGLVYRDQSPYVQVNLLELKFTILSIISNDSKFINTCNLQYDNDISHWGNDPFLHSGGFIIDDAPLPFRAMKFVVLTSLNGISIEDQAITLYKTNLVYFNEDKVYDLNKIIKNVYVTRKMFLTFYSIFFKSSINKFLGEMFKDSSNDFIQNSRFYSNKICSVDFKGFCDLELKDMNLSFKESIPIDSSNVDLITAEHQFSILNIYCDFMVIKWYEELLNKIITENKILCYPGSDKNSFIVNANHIKILQSHVKYSFIKVYQINVKLLKGVLAASTESQFSKTGSWFIDGIRKAKRVFSFRRHIPLFYEKSRLLL
ncbi:hypothetical protein AB834_03685 [PVC group bacterium (ex Bugula neritina AB1)]|nr:hypothetical protein AB834_03685 [PVC group bacterium (ex Bugula neritina AB1)]